VTETRNGNAAPSWLGAIFFFPLCKTASEGREKNSHEEEEGILRARVCVCVCVCWGAHVLGVVHSTPSDQSFPRWWWCYFYCSCESRVTLISPVTFVLLA